MEAKIKLMRSLIGMYGWTVSTNVCNVLEGLIDPDEMDVDVAQVAKDLGDALQMMAEEAMKECARKK